MDPSKLVTAKTKKTIVITPDQIAKLGLTLKLQSVIAPQLRQRASLPATTAANITPLKNSKTDKTTKVEPKVGSSRKSLPAKKNETAVKEKLSEVEPLVVQPDALKAKLKNILNKTAPEASKPKVTRTPKATPKKETKPRISKAKKIDIDEKVAETSEDTKTPSKLDSEETAITPKIETPTSKKRTPRNPKKLVTADQPSIKDFVTSTPKNSKFTIIQNEKVTCNKDTIDSIRRETKMLSPERTIRLSDTIMLGNTSPLYHTCYKNPEKSSGDESKEIGNKDIDSEKVGEEISALDNIKIVDEQEEKEVVGNLEGPTEENRFIRLKGVAQNNVVKENLVIKEKRTDSDSAGPSKVEEKSRCVINLESEDDKSNKLNVEIKEVEEETSQNVGKPSDFKEKIEDEHSDNVGGKNMVDLKFSIEVKEPEVAKTQNITRRSRVKVAPKLGPKLVSDTSKVANEEKKVETVDQTKVIKNKHSSLIGDSNLDVKGQEKVVEGSEGLEKEKVAIPVVSAIANRRSRIKPVVNIGRKLNANLKANEKIMEKDKEVDAVVEKEAPKEVEVKEGKIVEVLTGAEKEGSTNVEVISGKEMKIDKGIENEVLTSTVSEKENKLDAVVEARVENKAPIISNRRSRIKPVVNIGRKLNVNQKPNEKDTKTDEIVEGAVDKNVPTRVEVTSETEKKIDDVEAEEEKKVPTMVCTISENEGRIDEVGEKPVDNKTISDRRSRIKAAVINLGKKLNENLTQNEEISEKDEKVVEAVETVMPREVPTTPQAKSEKEMKTDPREEVATNTCLSTEKDMKLDNLGQTEIESPSILDRRNKIKAAVINLGRQLNANLTPNDEILGDKKIDEVTETVVDKVSTNSTKVSEQDKGIVEAVQTSDEKQVPVKTPVRRGRIKAIVKVPQRSSNSGKKVPNEKTSESEIVPKKTSEEEKLDKEHKIDEVNKGTSVVDFSGEQTHKEENVVIRKEIGEDKVEENESAVDTNLEVKKIASVRGRGRKRSRISTDSSLASTSNIDVSKTDESTYDKSNKDLETIPPPTLSTSGSGRSASRTDATSLGDSKQANIEEIEERSAHSEKNNEEITQDDSVIGDKDSHKASNTSMRGRGRRVSRVTTLTKSIPDSESKEETCLVAQKTGKEEVSSKEDVEKIKVKEKPNEESETISSSSAGGTRRRRISLKRASNYEGRNSDLSIQDADLEDGGRNRDDCKEKAPVCEIDLTIDEPEIEKIESEELIIVEDQSKGNDNLPSKIASKIKNKRSSRKSVFVTSTEDIVDEESIFDEEKTPKSRTRKRNLIDNLTPNISPISHSTPNIHQGKHASKKLKDKKKSIENDDKTATDIKHESHEQNLDVPEMIDLQNLENTGNDIAEVTDGSDEFLEPLYVEKLDQSANEISVPDKPKKKRGRKSKAELLAIAELEKQTGKRQRSPDPVEENLPKRAKKVDYISLNGGVENEGRASRKRKLSLVVEPTPKKRNISVDEKPKTINIDEEVKKTNVSLDKTPKKINVSLDEKLKKSKDSMEEKANKSNISMDEEPEKITVIMDDKVKKTNVSLDKTPKKINVSLDEKVKKSKDSLDEKANKSNISMDEEPEKINVIMDDEVKKTNVSLDETPKKINVSLHEKLKKSKVSVDEKPTKSNISVDEEPKKSFIIGDEKPKKTNVSVDEKPKRRNVSMNEEIKNVIEDEKPKRATLRMDEKPRKSNASVEKKPKKSLEEELQKSNFIMEEKSKKVNEKPRKSKISVDEQLEKSSGGVEEEPKRSIVEGEPMKSIVEEEPKECVMEEEPRSDVIVEEKPKRCNVRTDEKHKESNAIMEEKASKSKFSISDEEIAQYSQGGQSKIIIEQMIGDLKKIIDENVKELGNKRKKIEIGGNVICIVCKKEVKVKEWHNHKYRFHNNIAWRLGEKKPLDLTIRNINSILHHLYKQKKPFYCNVCNEPKKSPYGFLCHYTTCGKSEEELDSIKVQCRVCNTLSFKYIYMDHLKIHLKTPADDYESETNETNTQIAAKPNRKRKAAAKANTLFKNVAGQVSDDEDDMKKFYTKRKLKKSDLERIFAPEKKKELECIYSKCKESFNEIVEIFEHLKTCSKKGPKNCICKLCAAVFDNVPNVLKHINAKHAEELQENYDFSGDEDSEDEEEEEDEGGARGSKRPIKTLAANDKCKFYQFKFCKPSTFVVKELSPYLNSSNYLRTLKFCENNFDQEVFEKFPFISSNFTAVDPLNILNYLPKEKQSIDVGFQSITSSETKYNGDFKKFKLFETFNESGRITTFCGGPITSLAWAPTPYNSKTHQQVLAVSVVTDPDANYSYMKRNRDKSAIQFWNYGVLNNNSGEAEAKFEFCLVHNFGPILSMEWCPSGCNDEERLGLLAVSGSDGNVYGFAIGQPGRIKEKIVKAKPSFKLVLERWIDMDLGCEEHFATRISWSKASGHNYISVGYSNGVVAIFNLSTEHEFCNANDGDTVVFYPYIKFPGHLRAITGITLHFLNDGKRWLATGSADRECKFWDLDNFDNPIWVAKRFHTKQLIWLQNSLCTIDAHDDFSGVHSTSVVHLKDFSSIYCTTMLYSGSSVNSVSICDWGNLVMQGNDVGEITGCFNKHYFPVVSDVLQKRFFCGTITLVSKDVKEKNHVYKERSYQGAKNMFKMVFSDFPLNNFTTTMKHGTTATTCAPKNYKPFKPNKYPLESVTYLAINPNRFTFLYNAVGYQSGFLRVFRSSFLKANTPLN